MSPIPVKLALLLLLTGCLVDCAAQVPLPEKESRYYTEGGSFYHKNYTPKTYKGSAQNWDVLQDQFGNMLFANGDGVLIYDGRKWALVETPTESVIRSLAMTRKGEIYVGALDDLGFIQRMADGKSVYVSLLEKMDSSLRKMGNIWSTHVVDDEVYFEAETGLFKWDRDKFSFWPWPDASTFHKSFVWNNSVYVSEPGVGLLLLKNGKFDLAPGGEVFRNLRIYAAMPLNKDKIILGTKYDGLYAYDGTRAKVFQSAANAYFKQHEIYAGLTLPDETIAVGTKFGGAIILDQSGAVRSIVSREQGLPTSNVRAMGIDHNRDLWLALDEGISHIEIANGIDVYDERAGIESAVNDICRFDGSIYVTTINGAYKLQPAQLPFRRAHFEDIGLPKDASCWYFERVGDRLLISTSIGIFEVRHQKISRITTEPSFAIHRLLSDSNRIIIGADRGLYSLRLEGERWISQPGVTDLVLDNIKFNETVPGRLWITTYSQGAVLVSYINDNGLVDYDRPTVKHLGPADGLPEGFIKISSVGGYESFRVGTESQLFKYDYNTHQFYKDSTFSKTFGFADLHVFPVSNETKSGGFLMKTKRLETGIRKLFIVSPSGTQYRHKELDMSRIFENVGVITYWDQENNIAWHVGAELLVRQRLESIKIDTAHFAAFINKVIIGGDSVLFDGVGPVQGGRKISYALSSLRFEFTSNNFIAEESNLFQYKLEGYDEHWSEWSVESIKEYSRLWEGDYTFQVRSKDYSGRISKSHSFDFNISPPWFRTAVAYVAYLAAIGYLLWLLIRWRSRKLEQDKLSLQAEIAHQTLEIRQQNVQLAEQSEELKINAEQLKELDTMKSNFFVNISHEFRTPLSLILGPLEKFIDAKDHDIKLTELERMHRSAKRLQQLINQLLDLAKLESGNMKVLARQADLLYFLRVLTASFESLSGVKNIQYEVNIPPGSYETSFDSDKIETIIFNLLSNAFKFTPEGGRIDFQVNLDGVEGVSMMITDTGSGIPQSAIDHVFDRFYQVDGSSSREFEGSGIGLSLVKELVVLLNGTVNVRSELSKGTTFYVKLPLIGAYSVKESFEAVEPEPRNGKQVSNNEDKLVSNHSIADSEEAELILLIEDNEDLRQYLRENLEHEYHVEIAENGKAGLERAVELIPDLILSDMMMPLMDGFTLCTKIRADERTSHIPFILLTARATVESRLAGLELGADDYMTKPFNIKEVQVRIKNLLEQRRNLRKSYSKEVTLKPKNISITSVDEQFLNHALRIMEEHLSDQQFSVERFADAIGMSRKNLLRKIKALTDQSVNEFIRKFRLERAAQLIEGRAGTISEIAYQVGFNNLSYFSKCFKELFGVQPQEMLAKNSVNS